MQNRPLGAWRRPVLALAVLAAVLPAAPASLAQPVRLRAAQVFDDGHAWHKALVRMGEIMQERTGGAVTVQVYGRGVLGQEKDYIEPLLMGRLDLAVLAPGWAGNLAKQMSFLDMLFLWRDRAHWVAALDGEVGRKVADLLEKETAKGGHPGLKVLGYLGGSERYVMSRRQGYGSPAEFAGFKLRVLDSPPQIQSWKALGAAPVPLSFNLVMGALRAGTVDGLENEMGNAYQMKFHELAPHITETEHILTVRPLLMSGHSWRKLSPAQQLLLQDAAREAVALGRSLEWKQNQDAMAEMKRAGARFYPFPRKSRDQMRELTQPLREALAQELGLTDILQSIERTGTAAR
ncbi:MAG TPA: TRAP transporter substrate-binding protein [Vicinamibacteria bacterium]